MSTRNFALAVKSTLDYHINLLALASNVQYFDIDSQIIPENVICSDTPGIGWSLAHLEPDPLEPMYMGVIEIAVRSAIDPAQYVAMDLVSVVLDEFQIGSTFDVRNYSGAQPPTVSLGQLIVMKTAIKSQQLDRTAGFRFITIEMRGLRW